MRKSLAIFAAVWLAAPAAFAADPSLAQHRAFYEVRLGKGDGGGSVGAARGLYVYEYGETCGGGGRFSQRMQLQLQLKTGETVNTDLIAQGEESADGRRFLFDSRQSVDGKVDTHTKGVATLGAEGGVARFEQPGGAQIELPKDTVFSIGVVKALLKKIAEGERLFDLKLFLGDKVEPPYSMSVIVGRAPAAPPGAPVPTGDLELLEGKRTYLRSAFFPSGKSEVKYETSTVTLDNGVEVAGGIDQDGLSLVYYLSKIEKLPPPKC